MTPFSAATAVIPQSHPRTAETASKPLRRTPPYGGAGVRCGEWIAAGHVQFRTRFSAVVLSSAEQTKEPST